MPFRLGAVALPIGLLLLARKMPSPLAAFRKAGAISPETARKPSSLGLNGRWTFEDAQKAGLIVDAGDGRFYLNPVMDRARRRKWSIIMVSGAVLTSLVLAWFLL